MKWQLLVAASALTLAVLACGANNKPPSTLASSNGSGAVSSDPVGTDLNTPLPGGDPVQGQKLFSGTFPCSACHSLKPGQIIVGPSLAGIGTNAANRVSGFSAQQYLHQSIVSPDAFIVPGFHSDLMPSNFAQEMTAQQLADLIAFLLTQK